MARTLVLVLILLSCLALLQQVSAGYVLYKDRHQPVKLRVADLLKRMTLDEKIGQMTQIERSVANTSDIEQYKIGSVLSGGGSVPLPNATALQWDNTTDYFQRAALKTRLAIPMIYGIDAVHGHNNVYGATIFPHNVGLGCTRDPELVERIGAATASEVRATGIPYVFAPCIAVCRDPRWGRCYESYSEDPDVVASLTSIIDGLQGKAPKGWKGPYVKNSKKVAACAKHFVGDGGTTKGIDENNTVISYEGLVNIHMKGYPAAIKRGVATIMVSYSSWNGVKMHSNRFLITDVLKGQLGFEGMVISDWEGLDRITDPPGANYSSSVYKGIHAGIDMGGIIFTSLLRIRISPMYKEIHAGIDMGDIIFTSFLRIKISPVYKGIHAGIDMIMVPFAFDTFITDLKKLVADGSIPMSRIDDAVSRILRVKFQTGLFEYPYADKLLKSHLGAASHRVLGREAVRKSLVLLKNGKGSKPFLPLSKTAKKILVAGYHANDIGRQCGGWTITWQGGNGTITKGTTILEGIQQAMSPESKVVYKASPKKGEAKGKGYAYAIVVVGEEPYAEFMGDNLNNLTLEEPYPEVVKNTCSEIACVVVVISGRPIVIEPYLGYMDALVAAWLPGTEGNGIADVLFGNYEFQGKLSRTWFKTADQLPMNVGDKHYDPLYPFGFGLKMGIEKRR